MSESARERESARIAISVCVCTATLVCCACAAGDTPLDKLKSRVSDIVHAYLSNGYARCECVSVYL